MDRDPEDGVVRFGLHRRFSVSRAPDPIESVERMEGAAGSASGCPIAAASGFSWFLIVPVVTRAG
jgi:hypothetical protein